MLLMSRIGASARVPSRRARSRPPRSAMYSVVESPGRVATKIGSETSATGVSLTRAAPRSGVAGAVVAGVAVVVGGAAVVPGGAVVGGAVVGAGGAVVGVVVATVVADWAVGVALVSSLHAAAASSIATEAAASSRLSAERG